MHKSQFFYEVNVKSFSDRNGDGIGDLKGVYAKADYFKHLGIHNVIFSDILSVNEEDEQHSFLSMTKDIGNINDFKQVISKLKSNNIKTIIEIGIGNIRENHRWFKNAVNGNQQEFSQVISFKPNDEQTTSVKYSSENKQYYVVDQETQEVPLNWLSNQVIKQFIKIIKFWRENGVEGFLLKDFEFLADETKTNLITEETLIQLRKFYRAIKEIDDEIIVIGRSDLLSFDQSKELLSEEKRTFDYFIADLFYKNGISKKHGSDKVGKFSAKQLYKDMLAWATSPQHIVSFSSPKTGRFNARWNGIKNFQSFSAKAFATIQLLHPASSLIHYADELGVFNIGLTHLDDFDDPSLEARKRALGADGVSYKHFMQAQVLQNPVNHRSLMPWNGDKNGGFSSRDRTFIPPNIDYKEVNVAEQYSDESSVLNFYIYIINMMNKITPKQAQEATESFSIRFGNFYKNRDILILSFVLNGVKYSSYINTSSKRRKISGEIFKNVKISNYYHKKYLVTPIDLQPFETIIATSDARADDKAELQKNINKEVEKYKKQILEDIKDEKKEYINKLTQELTMELKSLEEKEKAIAKNEAKKEKLVSEVNEIIQDTQELNESKVEDISDNLDKEEKEIIQKTLEVDLKTMDENDNTIEGKINKEKQSVEDIKQKAKVDLEQRIKAAEDAIWGDIDEEAKSKLKEDELAFTTLLEDDKDLDL